MNFKGVKISNSAKKTEGIGEKFAKSLNHNFLAPIVISLEGELGGGKTTFVKGFARALEIDEMVKSPTFVIMRKYQRLADNRQQTIKDQKSPATCRQSKRYFYHFDCYRVKARDIFELGWKEIIENHENIVAVEWGDKIKNIMPKNYIQIRFKFINKNKRKITIKF